MIRAENELQDSASYWLVVEGQNFDFCIDDTQDLSTIRGGSLLLRDGITRADVTLQKICNSEAATLGGSIGIWRVTASATSIKDIASKIREVLSEEAFSHIPFVIAVLSDDGAPFSTVQARLSFAANRQRFAWPSAIYPTLPENRTETCPVDLIRPVPVENSTIQRRPDADGGPYKVSWSVAERRQYGMRRKQDIICEVTKDSEWLDEEAKQFLEENQDASPFAFQIGSISERSFIDKSGCRLKSNLADKICVVHLDGNGFGSINRRVLESNDTPNGQRAFDRQLSKCRTDLIASVFSLVIREGGCGAPTEEELLIREKIYSKCDGIVRFETLLFGGDEITFIVPARIGWRALQCLAEVAAKMEIVSQSVTFGIGAVFCHHDAPIARIRSLAGDLAEVCKNTESDANGKRRDGRKSTLFMPVVIESFDHVGNDVEQHLLRRLPPVAKKRGIIYLTPSAEKGSYLLPNRGRRHEPVYHLHISGVQPVPG